MRHGGQLLIDQLLVNGIDTIFCVPGESFLAAMDGLHDRPQIRCIVCRQEGGAAMMAEATGKLTNKPSVCFVTRGPGATNGSIGIHIARQDSTPMVMFVGLPALTVHDREAFQEFDLKAVFGALAKHAEVISDANRIPEYVSRAFHLAQSGRPGPVVLGLPEDMLSSDIEANDARPVRPACASPCARDLAQLEYMLARAVRPFMIVGGPGWSNKTKARVEEFAANFDLPVGAAFRYQDYFDNTHVCYAGHVGIGLDRKLRERIERADLLLALGVRLGEMTTQGYQLLTVPDPSQQLVHVHPSADELGSVFRAELPICATSQSFSDALSRLEPLRVIPWASHRAAARQDYEGLLKPFPSPGAIKLETIFSKLSNLLPNQTIITNGAGNYTAWLHRYYQFREYRTYLGPTAGAMGYGLPAAIAAKLAHPDRAVVALAGDGCFLMNGQEMATAKQYGLAIIILVINNGMYGTIRMHQERTYPGRVMATNLTNPDFAAMARSFGGHGEVVEQTDDFEPALARALHSRTLALVELRIDSNAISPSASLQQIRETSKSGR